MSDLVQGERIFSSVLYNSKEEVVGYVYVYSHENPDPITRELEYVMLDQNLNLAFRKVINYPKLKYYTPSIRRIFLVGDSLFATRILYSILFYQHTISGLKRICRKILNMFKQKWIRGLEI
ncbi:MAG: hypothetical protein IPN15_10655 [Saprospiraceae bacterium]|nr:hypothetical protein [Candidatus Vicinibacter affinis]